LAQDVQKVLRCSKSIISNADGYIVYHFTTATGAKNEVATTLQSTAEKMKLPPKKKDLQ